MNPSTLKLPERELLKQKVESVLKDDPASRNSDFVLTKAVATRTGANPALIMAEVRHIRQVFNNQKLYWPTEMEIAEDRKLDMKEWARLNGYTMDKDGKMIFFNKQDDVKTEGMPAF